ncbi:MAG: methyltransferase type 11, partial [Chloroflexota bacterium]|nr:methyltransferase type 11 [Chloroflexota bacterium]
RHRYSRPEVLEKLNQASFEVEQISWANTLLFVPAVGKRLLERSDGGSGAGGEPDLWQPPPALNRILQGAVSIEAVAIPRRLPLPFGLSVLALARAV